MPTSFQFGSREVTSRANVQTSVISVTLSALPSTIVPALSRVTEIICETKRTVSCAGAIAGFRADKLGLVDRNEARFGLLLVFFAILHHGLETVIDLGRQQILQGAPVAIGECQHDHLIGAARAREEMPRIERGVLGHDGVKPLGQGRAGLGQALPAIGRRDHVRRRHQRRLIDHRARHRNDIIVLRPLHHVARGAIVGRPLVSGALSEHVTQAQKNKDRQRQEDDGVNIHVAFAFWSAPATSPAVERSIRERQRLHHGWVCSM